MMKSSAIAATPDASVKARRGWRRDIVAGPRAAVRSTRGLEEKIKWGHPVYLSNGPMLLIRAEDTRVLFGFWRVSPTVAKRLVRAAVALNREVGDPTAVAPATSRARR
jgi:hypothetical protein